MLLLPKTIRVPTAKEMPHRTDLKELLERRREAQIVEGFNIRPNPTSQLAFAFTAEININNDRLWDLFLSLAETLPDEVSCTYGMSAEEPLSSGVWPIIELVDLLGEFETELVQDGFLFFGLIFMSRTEIVELQVTESKYIRYEGSDLEAFTECMVYFDLPQLEHLAFVDEYPKMVDPLQRYIPDSRPPEEVVAALTEAFQ